MGAPNQLPFRAERSSDSPGMTIRVSGSCRQWVIVPSAARIRYSATIRRAWGYSAMAASSRSAAPGSSSSPANSHFSHGSEVRSRK